MIKNNTHNQIKNENRCIQSMLCEKTYTCIYKKQKMFKKVRALTCISVVDFINNMKKGVY